MTTTVSIHGHGLAQTPGRHTRASTKWLLALLCLAAGVAPLAARSIHGELAEIIYGVTVASVLLAITLLTRRSSSLREFWQLPFAFFIFALVQILNNSVPPNFSAHVLHEHSVSGNPLASTVSGSIAIQLLDTLIAIVPIFVLTKVAGLDLGSVFARLGNFGRAYVIAIVAFVAIFVLIGLFPVHRLFPMHGTITLSRYLALTPALLVLVISNGFQEEFLFRGLFLQKYNLFFGPYVANVLQALIFAFAHAGVTYTPSALAFILVAVFPLGLVAGYMMRSSNGAIAPALFHAGVDIPIYLAFLTYVS